MSSQTGSERDALIDQFLVDHGLADADSQVLGQDASNRRYFRLEIEGESRLLMDAPPALENPRAFAQTTGYLQSLGARVPGIIECNLEQGLLLIEDLGDQTFTRLLQDGADERSLYRSAIEELAAMQSRFADQSPDISLPPYDLEATVTEAQLFTDWYLPDLIGRPMTRGELDRYDAIWQGLFEERQHWPTVLVHRDYHVDNLLMVDERCAMLDYQDALLGSPLYDLASLVEDARRDIEPALRQEMIGYWCELTATEPATITDEYRFWAAQRHCKVAGIFVRLAKRDGKSGYLGHIDRVIALLDSHLANDKMADLREFIASVIDAPLNAPINR